MRRPSETISGVVGSVVGALVGLLASFGVGLPDGAEAPLIILLSWVAAGVTWFVARKQRAKELTSNKDGTVAK